MALNEREKDFLIRAVDSVAKPLNVAGIITVKAVMDNSGRMVCRFGASFETFYPGDSDTANSLFGLMCVANSEREIYERLKAKYEQVGKE